MFGYSGHGPDALQLVAELQLGLQVRVKIPLPPCCCSLHGEVERVVGPGQPHPPAQQYHSSTHPGYHSLSPGGGGARPRRVQRSAAAPAVRALHTRAEVQPLLALHGPGLLAVDVGVVVDVQLVPLQPHPRVRVGLPDLRLSESEFRTSKRTDLLGEPGQLQSMLPHPPREVLADQDSGAPQQLRLTQHCLLVL